MIGHLIVAHDFIKKISKRILKVNFTLPKPYNNNKIETAFTVAMHGHFSSTILIIKIEDIFIGTSSVYESVFKFVRFWKYISVFESVFKLFAFGNTKVVV